MNQKNFNYKSQFDIPFIPSKREEETKFLFDINAYADILVEHEKMYLNGSLEPRAIQEAKIRKKSNEDFLEFSKNYENGLKIIYEELKAEGYEMPQIEIDGGVVRFCF